MVVSSPLRGTMAPRHRGNDRPYLHRWMTSAPPSTASSGLMRSDALRPPMSLPRAGFEPTGEQIEEEERRRRMDLNPNPLKNFKAALHFSPVWCLWHRKSLWIQESS